MTTIFGQDLLRTSKTFKQFKYVVVVSEISEIFHKKKKHFNVQNFEIFASCDSRGHNLKSIWNIGTNLDNF